MTAIQLIEHLIRSQERSCIVKGQNGNTIRVILRMYGVGYVEITDDPSKINKVDGGLLIPLKMFYESALQYEIQEGNV